MDITKTIKPLHYNTSCEIIEGITLSASIVINNPVEDLKEWARVIKSRNHCVLGMDADVELFCRIFKEGLYEEILKILDPDQPADNKTSNLSANP